MSGEDASETERRESLIELGMAKTLPKGLSDIVRVSNIAALKAIVPNGTVAIAVVDSVGALWTYMPLGDLVPDGITVVASNFTGEWWRGPTLIAVQSLAQSSWLLDPQNSSASDENTGLLGSPLKTFDEIVRRWGTPEPALTAAVVSVTWNSSGLTTDRFIASPVTGILILNGLQALAAPLILGTFVAKNRTAGTLATINITGHTWIAGTLIHDTTANAGFYVVDDQGGGTARISQPLSLPISSASTQVALANGDTLHVVTNPVINPSELGGSGAGNDASVIVNGLDINGGSSTLVEVVFVQLNESNITTLALVSTTGAEAFLNPVLTNCYVQPRAADNVTPIFGKISILGGVVGGAGGSIGPNSNFDQDVVVLLRQHADIGPIVIGSAYFGQWFENSGGTQSLLDIVMHTGVGGATAVYGPAPITLTGQQTIRIQIGTAVNALLCTGGITIAGLTTAFSFNRSTGAYAGPTSITLTNIDSAGALLDPLSGAGIVVGL